MKKMSEFWEYRQQVATEELLFAAFQAGRCIVSELLMRGFEQMAIPIEAALDEETAEGLYLVE